MRNNLPKYYNRGNDPLHARTRQQQKRALFNHPGDQSRSQWEGMSFDGPQQGPEMFNPLRELAGPPARKNPFLNAAGFADVDPKIYGGMLSPNAIAAQMPLEQRQSVHNSVLAESKNYSGSNDLQQIKHDMNETLIRGAELLDAGRSAGLNDDQTLQVAMRQLGLQQSRDTNLPQRELIQRARTNVADDSILKEIGKRQGR